MVVALTGERVHTEITEHGEVMENFFRCFLSVPSPASVSSVFTRFTPQSWRETRMQRVRALRVDHLCIDGGRVHTEIAEHVEDTENSQRMSYSVPSPTSVISVFTRSHSSISTRNEEAAPA